jgi:hypothetical protein
LGPLSSSLLSNFRKFTKMSDVLDPALRAKIYPAYGSIAEDLVTSGKKRKRQDKPSKPIVAPPQNMSRAERRASKSKLKKIERLEVSPINSGLR